MDDLSFGGGTQFDFTYASGTSTEQIIGFEMAGQIWSSYLDDDVTVRIHVESTDQLPEDVIGAALPGKKKKENYDKVRDNLVEDATSSDDLEAIFNLPSLEKEFGIVVDGQELNKTKEFKLTNANAKALDLLKDDRKKLDGYILVNDLTGQSTTGWDYDALRSGNGGGQLDFLSVAMHEVGHVLGFVSGIDDDGWLEVLTKAQQEEKEIKDNEFKFATPLDLFRYSDNDSAAGKIDLSTGGNPYFSLDGGDTNLANFSTGAYTDFNGDGYQASHWKNGNAAGIMNPILRAGVKKDVSSLDLQAMDVIGWDINTSGLDWQEMYDNAVLESETAAIQDRSKDVEKMIKESEYEGRRTRSSSGNLFAWQFGFWQFTTVEDVAAAEIPEIVESVEENDSTESTILPPDDAVDESPSDSLDDDTSSSESPVLAELDPETDSTEPTILPADDAADDEVVSSDDEQPDSLNDDTSSSESPEPVELAPETDSTESTILQPSDTSGLDAVASDEQQEDPLLSGGLTEGV